MINNLCGSKFFNASKIPGQLIFKEENQIDGSSLQPSIVAGGNYYHESYHDQGQFLFLLTGRCMEYLRQLGEKYDSKVLISTLAAFNTLLYRYNDQGKIAVLFTSLSKVANNKETLDGGAWVDKVILQTDLSDNPCFTELMDRIERDICSIAVRRGQLGGITDENGQVVKYPDCNVTMVFRNNHEKAGIGQDLQSQWVVESCLDETNSLNIVLSVTNPVAGDIEKVNYDYERLALQFIQQMTAHLEQLLGAIIKDPDQRIGDLVILTSEEIHQLLVTFGESKVNYPREKSIIDLFENSAEQFAKSVAVVFENKKISYKELNEQSNQLAHYLRTKLRGEETLIPICFERSMEMIIAIMGVLKAGAAYVPISPGYPLERIKFMIGDIRATILLCNKETSRKLEGSCKIENIETDLRSAAIRSQPKSNLTSRPSSRQAAYVIYTSGSTGKPKGVMIEHQAIIDHCYGLISTADLKQCSSFALFSPLVFDAGHSILFTSFLVGATLHVMSQRLIMEGDKLAFYLHKNSIDCIKIVPSLWLSYARNNNFILAKKVMIFGGEAFPKTLPGHLATLKYKGRVFNHYGPTETTIGKCIHQVHLQMNYDSIPIGKPFSNTQLFVLDRYLQLVPPGFTGELYIAGEGLARKYLNEAGLTREKFVANPFSKDPGSRMYRTGDKVRWLPEGNLEYLGRIDQQVKINGYRIELAEIESALSDHPSVHQVVVIAQDDSTGVKRLVAYLVLRENQPANTENIRHFLSEKLPDYMVPSAFVILSALPLTSNDKIDRAALPDPRQKINEKLVKPRNATETRLKKIFLDCLQIKNIGVTDNYFDTGADSMQAHRIFSRIKKTFHTQLPISILFQAPTIEQLAKVLRAKDPEDAVSWLVPIQPNGSRPPLFLLHAAAGTVLFYWQLTTYLGKDQPVYGIQATGMNGKHYYDEGITVMAAKYIDEIRKVSPNGPYLLGGYCFGGLIAFEMARQLTVQGFRVDLLANFNSISPTFRYPATNSFTRATAVKPDPSLEDIIVISEFSWKILAQLNAADRASYLSKKIKHAISRRMQNIVKTWKYKTMMGYLAVGVMIYKFCERLHIPYPDKFQEYYFMITNASIAKAYKPQPYPGQLTIFRSPEIFSDPTLGWKNYVTGGIKTVDIPGYHSHRREIMNEPAVQSTAAELKKALTVQ
ncbi:MAG: amino acid adenylation domain protein [Ferruginibacter sp.]|nr:amino acid adenylation domain protein [Ferruginibacter sp.]